MTIIYFIVGFIATTVGALAGLGGGVIIKPVLDALGHYDIATIGVLSSATVFSMSVVSLSNRIISGIKLEGKRTIMIALGSILGGVLGKSLFKNFLHVLNNEELAKTIQASILAVLMIIVLILVNNKDKIKQLNINNLIYSFVVGVVLGTISSFLGIGGGPLNVAILAFLFSMDTKAAAIHSIFIIFFSQLSGLTKIYFSTGFSTYDLKMLYYMIPGGIAGGYIGSILSNKLNNRHIQKLFNITLIVIILINIYNIFS